MRLLGCSCIVVALTTTAFAQEATPVVEQHAAGMQHADNEIEAVTLEALTDAFMTRMLSAGVTGTLTQSGSNSINSVQYSGDLDQVVQRFNGTQSVTNSLGLGVLDIFGDVSQRGNNIANSSQSRTLNFAGQMLGDDARQAVLNTAEFAILYGSIEQSGSNIANNAVADVAIGTASQDILKGAVQKVTNRLELAAMSAIASAVNQRGENFGNIMISDEVDRVTRDFAGDQIIHNVVVLADGAPGTINQYGINVANLITSSKIGSLSQTSSGHQSVTNEVFDAHGNLLSGGNISQVSENYVNMIVLTAPADGSDGAIISVEQSADYPQTASGSGNQSQTGNSLSVTR